MPVELIYLDDGGVIMAGSGVVTGAEIVAANQRMYQTTELITAMVYQICNFTRVARFDVPTADVITISRLDKRASELNPIFPIAVVGQENLVYGLLRMWESYASDSPNESAVFRTMEEARDWIESKIKAVPSLPQTS